MNEVLHAGRRPPDIDVTHEGGLLLIGLTALPAFASSPSPASSLLRYTWARASPVIRPTSHLQSGARSRWGRLSAFPASAANHGHRPKATVHAGISHFIQAPADGHREGWLRDSPAESCAIVPANCCTPGVTALSVSNAPGRCRDIAVALPAINEEAFVSICVYCTIEYR